LFPSEHLFVASLSIEQVTITIYEMVKSSSHHKARRGLVEELTLFDKLT
jgi:hypothetical protein